jgi:hypothetical protein
MKWILFFSLSFLVVAPAGAAFYDTAYLKRLLDNCNSLPESFEASAENFDKIKDCGLSTGYILGIYDALNVMADRSRCPPATLQSEQAVAVVASWIRDHPEQMSKPADKSVRSALDAAWPCSKQ